MQKFAFVFLLDAKHFSAIFPLRFFILTKFFCSIIFFIPKNMSSFFYYIILYDYFCTVLFYSTEIIKRFFRMILLVYCLKHQIYSFFSFSLYFSHLGRRTCESPVIVYRNLFIGLYITSFLQT